MNIPVFFNKRKNFTVMIAIFMLTIGLTVLLPETVFAKMTPTKVQVEIDGETKNYSNATQTVSLDGKNISTKKLPSTKINGIWMVSISEVFGKGLGCTYTYDDTSKQITITNPNMDVTVSFILGSKEFAMTGEDEEDKNSAETLPCQAVSATNLKTDDTGILVPVSFLANKLGFHYTYHSSDNKIVLTTATFLDRDRTFPEYDISVYSNVLTTVLLEGNSAASREELSLITLNATTEEKIIIDENETAGIYTYTFLNTYNAVGDFEKNFSASFVKKIIVTTSGQNVVVKVSFNKKCSSMTLLEEDGISASFSSATYSLKVKLPESVKFSKVKDTDQYMKNQFILQIPGNWKSYYKENPIITNNSVIKKVNVTSNSEKTYITVNTKKLQGYMLAEKDGYFTVKIDDPRKIYSKIVVLDAGHGGKDNGTTNRGTKEKNLNYTMIYSKAKKYFDSDESDIKAYWTRTDDTFVTLWERAKFASAVGADLFLSLHMNSCSKSSINGIEIYYSKDNNRKANGGLTSQIFARRMLNRLIGALNAPSRGVKSAGFYVIKHNTVPAILIELGFLSGNSDYHKLTSDSYQNRAVNSIYQCVDSIFTSYPTGR